MITNFRHTGIVVSDLDASLRFYGERLGFTVTKRLDEAGSYINNMLALSDVKVTTVKMKAPDGVLIELLHFKSHPRKRPAKREACDIGITHIAVTVADLDAFYETMTKAGVEFNAPPQLSPDGMVKVTFCRDPDGNLIEVVEMLKQRNQPSK